MIRYALLAVAAVIAYLWYKSRTTVATRGAGTGPVVGPFAALGQLLGGAFFAANQTPNPGVKPSADAVYSRLGSTSPSRVTASTNYSTSGLTPEPSPVYRSEYGTGGSYTAPELAGLRNEATGTVSYYREAQDQIYEPKDNDSADD
jgi:hypothetical protein